MCNFSFLRRSGGGLVGGLESTAHDGPSQPTCLALETRRTTGNTLASRGHGWQRVDEATAHGAGCESCLPGPISPGPPVTPWCRDGRDERLTETTQTRASRSFKVRTAFPVLGPARPAPSTSQVGRFGNSRWGTSPQAHPGPPLSHLKGSQSPSRCTCRLYLQVHVHPSLVWTGARPRQGQPSFMDPIMGGGRMDMGWHGNGMVHSAIGQHGQLRENGRGLKRNFL